MVQLLTGKKTAWMIQILLAGIVGSKKLSLTAAIL